ncbi:hypothetical protein RB597_010198 [Gaeumannomyces tritici]
MKFHFVLLSTSISLAAARPLGQSAGVSAQGFPAAEFDRRGLFGKSTTAPKTGNTPAAPKTGNTPAAPKTGNTPAAPKTGNTPAAPKNGAPPKGDSKTSKPKCRRGKSQHGGSNNGEATECDAAAAPAVKVPVMSVAECKAHLNAAAGSKLLFWSSVKKQANAALKDATKYPQLVGYKTLGDITTPKNYYDTYMAEMKAAKKAGTAGAVDEITADDKYWNDCSQAFASIATGTVYVMLPANGGSGVTWGSRAQSHWAQHEFPIICKGTAVTKLVRINADTGVEEDITTLVKDLRTTGKCPALAA